MCSEISGTCFFWRFWAPQAAQHTRTLLGDPKTGRKTTKYNKTQYKTINLIFGGGTAEKWRGCEIYYFDLVYLAGGIFKNAWQHPKIVI